MAKKTKLEASVHTIPYAKPQNAKEYYVQVGDIKYTVWEFPFKYFKRFGGSSLSGVVAQVYFHFKLIIIDSNLLPKNKRWVLRHEIVHAIRHEGGTALTDKILDELETELLVLADSEPSDWKFSTQEEVLDALYRYLKLGDPAARARKLIEFLGEETNGQETRPEDTNRVSTDTVSSGVRQFRTTDPVSFLWEE